MVKDMQALYALPSSFSSFGVINYMRLLAANVPIYYENKADSSKRVS